jgi:hypothetical protein
MNLFCRSIARVGNRQGRDRIAGYRVELGDSTDLASLVAAGLHRASAIVVSYNDTAAARKIIRLVKEPANHVPVIVRTEDDRDYDTLILSERRGYSDLRSDKSVEVV